VTRIIFPAKRGTRRLPQRQLRNDRDAVITELTRDSDVPIASFDKRFLRKLVIEALYFL
jgi:hypothetical protein